MLNLFQFGLPAHILSAPAEPLPDTGYAFTSGILTTNGEGHPGYSSFGYDFADQVLYDAERGKFLLIWMQKEGDPHYADNVVLQFDAVTLKLEKAQVLGFKVFSTNRDYHCHAVMAKTADGEYLFACEQRHNSYIQFFKTVGGDINNLRYITRTTGGGAYPKLYVQGNRVLCFLRGPGFNNTWCFASYNDGETWPNNYPVTAMDAGDLTDRFYAHKPIQAADGHWHLVVSLRRDQETTQSPSIPNSWNFRYTESYWLVSEDGGVNWRNLQGTFSKNVRPDGSTQAPITLEELQQHFMYAQVPHDDSQTIEPHGFCVLPSGKVFVQTGKQNEGTGATDIRVFENGSWTIKPFSIPDMWRPQGVFAHDENTVDLFVTEGVQGDMRLCRYRSTDGATSWQKAEEYASGDTSGLLNYLAMTPDYNAAKRLMFIGKSQGGYSDLLVKTY